MSALQALSSWPVEHAAGAVIAANRMETVGDQGREYELASVTKLLTAYAFLIAVEEGAWELDTLLPGGYTVEQLLSHTGGVGFDTRELQAAPGEKRIYSSAGYEILADHLAQICQMPFPEYLHEAVLDPLGMHSTRLLGSAGHGATSTVSDMRAFLTELLDPTLLDPRTLADAMRNHGGEVRGIVPGYGMHKPNQWGLGFEIKAHKKPHWTGLAQPPTTVGHFGVSGTFLWVVPQERVGAVVLTDRPFGPWAKPAWTQFNDAVYGEFKPQLEV